MELWAISFRLNDGDIVSPLMLAFRRLIIGDDRGELCGEGLGEFDLLLTIANANATSGGGTKTELKPGDLRPPFAVRGETDDGGVGPSSASVGGSLIDIGRLLLRCLRFALSGVFKSCLD